MRFLPYSHIDASPNVIPNVIVDGASTKGTVLTLSHWPKSGTPADLMAAQSLVRRLPIGEAVVDAILDLVRAARPHEGVAGIADHLAWGPGPRAGQALMLAVRARALIQGRFAPSLDDVRALAAPVLKHRLALNYSARAEGETMAGLISRLVARLP